MPNPKSKMRKNSFRVDQASVSFWLKVKPHSARERLSYDSGGELRLEVHAAPAEEAKPTRRASNSSRALYVCRRPV